MVFFNDSKRVDYKIESNVRVLNFYGNYIKPERMATGNMKLHNILIFDLPAIETCLNCSDCKAKCYAMKAQRLYHDVRIYRKTNLELFKIDKELLKELIVSQIQNSKVGSVRLHSSGDFFSQDYIDFWCDIIGMFKDIKFYAYTKVKDLFDFSIIEGLNNFNLIDSYVNDIMLNFGSYEYCKQLQKNYGTFICPATMNHNNDSVKCGLDCTYCITKKNVCFIEH